MKLNYYLWETKNQIVQDPTTNGTETRTTVIGVEELRLCQPFGEVRWIPRDQLRYIGFLDREEIDQWTTRYETLKEVSIEIPNTDWVITGVYPYRAAALVSPTLSLPKSISDQIDLGQRDSNHVVLEVLDVEIDRTFYIFKSDDIWRMGFEVRVLGEDS
ncbi:hypothetical protein ACQ4M3_09690 [Leptolyngbya sp. AN03gr2]|uniref:hypothetical protein n=1 Tax=Leptolyngbya sp. AN03gr2 TaxID=3423364 RepID=UPI003D31CCA9